MSNEKKPTIAAGKAAGGKRSKVKVVEPERAPVAEMTVLASTPGVQEFLSELALEDSPKILTKGIRQVGLRDLEITLVGPESELKSLSDRLDK